MSERWEQIAERIVDGLGVRDGEVVQLRDLADRAEITQELLLAIERRGATPLLQLLAPEYLRRMLMSTDAAHLAQWDRQRGAWLETTGRIIVLVGADPDLAGVPSEARAAWREAVGRLVRAEEQRCIPQLVAAIPTANRAEQLGMPLPALEEWLAPALGATPDELRPAVDPVLAAVAGSRMLTIRSGAGCTLNLDLAGRRPFAERGAMPAAGTAQPGTQTVLNMPSGSVYTTVAEAATRGSLWLPEAAGAHDVTLHFEHGRVARIEAAQGAAQLEALFDAHTGEPRRLSHIGIGLNPYLQRPLGWTLVDEHCHGALFIAFGENRYLGGQNESSLNVDFALPNADLLAEDRPIVSRGQVVVK